ncbi:hypothetical protein HNO88_003002 [Novosphingobium chloroacetimidivorans]|uniref:Uncharacterized protein n=1 Tax=Novosphingobium chloroacetimidivorans TaxID=1428314 RepID=A0A7W7NWK4_9SPHN|nr:hypothetical protein [Novosphingobium chloroacetimidivorans]MBB4859673.1 hypothetical protein [Novosphingobium chloroacetimidivorans]
MPLQPNPGKCPAEAAGRRVRVVLFNGTDTARTEPGGWAADGKSGCTWRIHRPPHPFDIKLWELI